MKNNKIKSTSINSMMVASISGLAFIIGFFVLLIIGLNSWGKHLQSQMKVYVYFDDSLQVNQINETIQLIKKEKQVDVSNIQFVTKEHIAKDFLASSHENFEELLGDVNPFKNLAIVGLTDSSKTINQISGLATKFKSIAGVYDVSYPSQMLMSLTPKIKIITSIVSILILILCIWIYVQLSNYIRLQIHGNRLILKSMQLLGSTDQFIRKPYIINSLILGFIGSVLGYAIINGLILYITSQIPEIQLFVFNMETQLILFISILLFCVLFSIVSTYFSVQKYLKNSHVNLI
jgi:cell division transport system permease protein